MPPGSKPRTARAASERDRSIAKLGLGLVEELPRDVLVDTLQVGLECMLFVNKQFQRDLSCCVETWALRIARLLHTHCTIHTPQSTLTSTGRLHRP